MTWGNVNVNAWVWGNDGPIWLGLRSKSDIGLEIPLLRDDGGIRPPVQLHGRTSLLRRFKAWIFREHAPMFMLMMKRPSGLDTVDIDCIRLVRSRDNSSDWMEVNMRFRFKK